MNEVADAPLDVTQTPEIDEGSELTPIEAYRQDFDLLDSSPAREPAWLRDIRREAIAQFESEGFPTMKSEDWHFTSVAPIADRIFNPAIEGSQVSADVVARFGYGQDWHTLVFVNGRLQSDPVADLPEGVIIESLPEAIEGDVGLLQRHFGKLASADSGSFTALNAAFARDGAVIRIASEAVVAKPIHLLFISDGEATGEVYCAAHHLTEGPPRRSTVLHIRYRDRYRRTAEGCAGKSSRVGPST